MAPDLDRLPVHCAHCGELVTLHLANSPHGNDQYWACPWCYKTNDGDIPGRLVNATRGHEPSEPRV